MNDVKFKFAEPKHGWMDVKVSDGEQKISLMVSDVPCDSIYKLAYTLLGLQSGDQSEEVEFSLEPEYALWKFITQNEDIEIHVFPNSNLNNPEIFRGQREKVIKRLYKGLRDLEALPCWKEPDVSSNIWSWEFPSHELNQFKKREKNR